MRPNDYQKLASRTECDEFSARERIISNDPIDITVDGQLVPTRLLHGTLGLITESGEIADALKRWIYYGQDLDETNVKEEIGDCLWYLALICNTLGFDLEDVMESNIAKLKTRYPNKYNDYDAAEENRNREAEAKAVEDKKEFLKVHAARTVILTSTFLCPCCSYKVGDVQALNLLTGKHEVQVCPECKKSIRLKDIYAL